MIPNTIVHIGARAFYGSDDLISVIFETDSQVRFIGYEAFYNVILESIVIPLSVETMGFVAFHYERFDSVYSMTVYCMAESKPEGWSPFWNQVIPVVWGYTPE